MSNRNDLIVACRTNDVEVLEKFVAEHKESDDYIILDERGYSPLHNAISYNSYQIVEKLLKNELVDVLQKTRTGFDCLTIAMLSTNATSDMVKLLVDNDEDFLLVDQCMEFVVVLAVKFDDKLRTMVGALKTRNYTIPQHIESYRIAVAITINGDPEKFHYFLFENIKLVANDEKRVKKILRHTSIALYLCHLPGSSDAEQSKWIEVLNKVFTLFRDLYADDFTNYLVSSLAEMLQENLTVMIDWCIKTWYLADSNQHCGLVEKLLKQPNGIQNSPIIIGLHSSITNLMGYFTDSSRHMYKQLVQTLLKEAAHWRIEDIIEVGCVLGPKLDDQLFSFAFYSYFNEVVYENGDMKHENVSSIVKLVDIMQINNKTQHTNVYHFLDMNTWVPFMAFSTDVTADIHVSNVQNLLESIASFEIEEDYNFSNEMWLEIKASETLAQFCVQGDFRAKTSLKSLCRAKIRETLLKPKLSHSQLVQYVKQLGLPKKIEQFVLFNYTGYDF